MIDFVLNEELIKYTKEFGFEKIYPVEIFSYDNIKKSKNELIFVRADNKNIRKIFENEKINCVFGLEFIEEKDDLHYKKSGLNQVLCNLALKNKISIGFSFDDILNAKDRARIIGRMIQNVSLCKKYKINIVFASFAKDKWGMRLWKDFEAFGRLIGIDKLDNKKIFKLKENDNIKVIG
ncbi:hypothetical protein HYT56_00700 [Candidatus Woesearchaeota archaeon]|nr:hypothetical protein [Candidatus Woesearchaeota archaeon]